MVDEVILKKQVTSYFLEKSITAITKVITDVWRKGWARSLEALGLGLRLRDPLASLDQGEFLIDAVRTQCQLPNIRMAEWSIPGCDPTTYEPLLPAERLRAGDPDLLLAGTARLHGADLSFCSNSASGPDHAEWHAAAVIVCEQWSLQGFAGQYRDGQKSFS